MLTLNMQGVALQIGIRPATPVQATIAKVRQKNAAASKPANRSKYIDENLPAF
jgi:hypothetical protein